MIAITGTIYLTPSADTSDQKYNFSITDEWYTNPSDEINVVITFN